MKVSHLPGIRNLEFKASYQFPKKKKFQLNCWVYARWILTGEWNERESNLFIVSKREREVVWVVCARCMAPVIKSPRCSVNYDAVVLIYFGNLWLLNNLKKKFRKSFKLSFNEDKNGIPPPHPLLDCLKFNKRQNDWTERIHLKYPNWLVKY